MYNPFQYIQCYWKIACKTKDWRDNEILGFKIIKIVSELDIVFGYLIDNLSN